MRTPANPSPIARRLLPSSSDSQSQVLLGSGHRMNVTVRGAKGANQGDSGPIDQVVAQVGSARTVAAARAALRTTGKRRATLRQALPFLGPAFIASVAYIDPGNFATN